MANKSLFASFKSLLPRATARNEANGVAYALEPKHARGVVRCALRQRDFRAGGERRRTEETRRHAAAVAGAAGR